MYFNIMQIQFLKLSDQAKIPTKATGSAAGFDIASTETMEICRGESHIFHTGLAASIDEGYCVVLFDRSGMGAKKNIHRLAGVIDSDYRGEWLVCLCNLSRNSYVIHAGDNIVQGLVLPVPQLSIVEVTSLDDTVRGCNGFGSSDKVDCKSA
jgi:dUTP pyrophosphatase